MRPPSVIAALFAAALAGIPLTGTLSGAMAQDRQTITTDDQVAAGREFAHRVCWACHIVSKTQTEDPILQPPAPSFLDIAQRPNLTAAWLRTYLSSHSETMGSHGQMPNPRLVDYQIDEVAAYIMSLRSK